MQKDVTKMTYGEVRKEWERIRDEARPRVAPRCKACLECDSLRPKCGFVSSERGKSGIRNYEKIQQIKLACRHHRLPILHGRKLRQCVGILLQRNQGNRKAG